MLESTNRPAEEDVETEIERSGGGSVLFNPNVLCGDRSALEARGQEGERGAIIIMVGTKASGRGGQRKRIRTQASATAKAQSVSPMKGGRYEADLRLATEAVRLASKLCRASQLQLRENENTNQTKRDKLESPVTVADLGAQAIVSWALQNLPNSGAVTRNDGFSLVAEEDSDFLRSEEGADLRNRVVDLVNNTLKGSGLKELTEAEVLLAIDEGRSEGGSDRRHWVLDPIDGTRGFVGNRQYAIALALLDEGEPVLGVLGCPNLSLEAEDLDARTAAATSSSESSSSSQQEDGSGYLFVAEKRRGAYKVGIEIEAGSSGSDAESGAPGDILGHRISVDEVDPNDAVYMESVETKHSDHAFARKVAENSGINKDSLKLDSQVKYGVIASGKASAFMRFPDLDYKEWIWDHAAGAIIMEEAGGVVTDSEGKKLDFSKGRTLNNGNGIVAAPPKLHRKLIESIKALGR